MSHHSSSSEDASSIEVYPEGEEEPLPKPLPPPTPVADSLTRQHVCGDRQGACNDDESLDLRPPALKKPQHKGTCTFCLVITDITTLAS